MRSLCTLTCIVVSLLACNANAQHVRETQEYVDAAYARMWRQEHRHAEQPLLATPPPCCQWTTPVVIDTSTPGLTAQAYAALAVSDSGHLVAAWMDVRNWSSSTNQIVTAFSTDKGSTWRRSVPFTNLYWCAVRDIAFDRQGNIWLLWTSGTNQFGPFFLNLSKSTNAGQTFTTVFTSREYAGAYFQSKLAIDMANNVFMLWDDQQFKLTRFRNGDIGQRVDAEIPNDTLRVDFWCSMAVGLRGRVACLWAGSAQEGGALSVFSSYSVDSGQVFSSNVRVDSSTLNQRYPACNFDERGTVHVAYSRRGLTINDLILAVSGSSNDGRDFRQPGILASNGFNTDASLRTFQESTIYISWAANNGTVFSRSTNAGIAFSSPQVIGTGVPDLGNDHRGGLFSSFDAFGAAVRFARTIHETSDFAHAAPIPETVVLFQNVPNPFNSSTMIRFSIPTRAHVILSVHDLLGRYVRELANGYYLPGQYHYVWEVDDLATGVYLARLQVGPNTTNRITRTRRLVLIR